MVPSIAATSNMTKKQRAKLPNPGARNTPANSVKTNEMAEERLYTKTGQSMKECFSMIYRKAQACLLGVMGLISRDFLRQIRCKVGC